MATEIERGGLDLGGPHEPSYYEIALTNRQVVVAFVVLLVCLVAAFLSGMWIGRDSGARAGQQVARLTPPAGATADKTDAQPQALPEFKFFNETKRRPGAETAPAPAPSTPAADDATAETAPPPTRAAKPAPPAAAASVPEKPAPSAVVPEPSPAPKAARTPPVSAAPAPSTGTSAPVRPVASAATGDVVIQVFSTADKDQADKLLERLVKAGQPAFLSPIDKNGTTMYRVRIGPFSSRESAQAIAERVRREQKLDTWITPK